MPVECKDCAAALRMQDTFLNGQHGPKAAVSGRSLWFQLRV